MSHATKAPRVITAANPSALTGPGTNTFLLGRHHVAVIDPGPDLPAHRAAILAAIGDGQVSHILVTHAHLDHSAGARALADATGAPILAYGGPEAGRSAVMQRLAEQGGLDGGEGLDRDFQPDMALVDGAVVQTDEWALTALHTPGHSAGHLSFCHNDMVFCGDVVMGWSSTIISPPDGDLADYFRTLARLQAQGARQLLPAHGAPIDDPTARIDALAAHRRARSGQILQALQSGPGDAHGLARRIYEVAPALMPAAARNVLAHLIALHELGAVRAGGQIGPDTVFSTV